MRNFHINKKSDANSQEIHIQQIVFLGKVSRLGIIKLKVVLIIEKWQVKPLPSWRFHRVDRISDASTNENSIKRKCHQKYFRANRGRKSLRRLSIWSLTSCESHRTRQSDAVLCSTDHGHWNKNYRCNFHAESWHFEGNLWTPCHTCNEAE